MLGAICEVSTNRKEVIVLSEFVGLGLVASVVPFREVVSCDKEVEAGVVIGSVFAHLLEVMLKLPVQLLCALQCKYTWVHMLYELIEVNGESRLPKFFTEVNLPQAVHRDISDASVIRWHLDSLIV